MKKLREEKTVLDIVKIIGIGIISLVIIIIIKQYKPEFAIYVSLVSGIIILFLIMGKLDGIIQILKSFANKASINSEFLIVLLKITGIAIMTEYVVSVCKDAGESAIASKVDLGGRVIIISMSIPIISGLLENIMTVLS